MTKIIAELGMQHDGSVMACLAAIDRVAACFPRPDYVKLQLHLPLFESSHQEPFRKAALFPQDATRWDYWTRTEWGYDQWKVVIDRIAFHYMKPLLSVFSPQAVDLARYLTGPDLIKIPSGEFWSSDVMIAAHSKFDHLLISTGMCKDASDAIYNVYRKGSNERITLMSCKSQYPGRIDPAEAKRLHDACHYNLFGWGVSSHAGNLAEALAVRPLKPDYLEVHVDALGYGPDKSSSISVEELGKLVNWYRPQFEVTPKSGQDLKAVFGKSVVAAKNIYGPIVLSDLRWGKPGTGFKRMEDVVGKRAPYLIPADTLITPDMIQ